uniref:DNA-directed DNA polymerase n=1 Tax=viral metagenome TaxID=1070528 RepID=A0A6C0HQW4_9ZZZZ
MIKLFDFHVYNEAEETEEKIDNSFFRMQMFGINEQRETCSIFVEDFKPFFYIKVDDSWTQNTKKLFVDHIKTLIGAYYKDSFCDCEFVEHKKLYGFDGGRTHPFIKFSFTNTIVFNKVKNLWYSKEKRGMDGEIIKDDRGFSLRNLLPNGFQFQGKQTYLYEANIPSLLRYFHIQEISPSGWIKIPTKYHRYPHSYSKKTTCMHEYYIPYSKIIPLPEKDTMVAYKICSFDIEASSSHGDFPLPIKTYKKLAINIVTYFTKHVVTKPDIPSVLRELVLTAFRRETRLIDEIDEVFPCEEVGDLEVVIDQWLKTPLNCYHKTTALVNLSLMEKIYEEPEEESWFKPKQTSNTIIELLLDNDYNSDAKINTLVLTFDGNVKKEGKMQRSLFPRLEGDKVTFIGSTFTYFGEEEPYLNHCIALNDCDETRGTQIESYSTEKEVLLAWKEVIKREDPDIIIGYNIFGFDYMFMFERAKQCECEEEFLDMSRNIGECCGNRQSGELQIEESNIKIASGTHELRYIKMTGRIQIDLYNYFRREENLGSYKLDYVAGYFIGDYITSYEIIEYEEDEVIRDVTRLYTNNMTGITVDSFIHFEEITYTTEYYADGAKFRILDLDKREKWLDVEGSLSFDKCKKIRWCLAKDDVTPQDIFRMTNGPNSNSSTRATIAKYCIQDCNLVQQLFNKVDLLTGFIEMAKICSIPINFIVMRGQGIKLLSYVAKKCREKNTLMPVIEKGNMNDGYEGAIVLDPKCSLYLDNPVACVDYASLYPSSMISEELSHDSKVWAKVYNLKGELIGEEGEKENGAFKYDNLSGYNYVDITYDTYVYVRKTPKSAAEKIKSGYKTCRFAQFPIGKAIMPSILEELLLARKTTRKLIPQQTDDFMKNILDKRQLAYKVTANSLYGQCGAKTSAFYEQDIAAATTATGRLLLTYAKTLIEGVYANKVCETTEGVVRTNAEYIYGDTDSVFFTFNLSTLDGEKIRGKRALAITIELAQEAGALATKFLKAPHELEYEKTFMPFCLLSKKRYVGILYEHDVNKGKRKEMGIVLKRRDNAPIVKDIYGGVIDILMKEQNIRAAIQFLRTSLKNIVDKNCSIEKLIISKSLNSYYKNPQQIAHKVLADRIASRDPGNKPNVGDRIPFVYVHHPNKKALQGEKIETPTFIRSNNLQIDYSFYITNQIMKPIQQLFALVLEDIWREENKTLKIRQFKKECSVLRKGNDDETYHKKLETLKNKEVKTLLFDDYLRVTNNEKEGMKSLKGYFK